jgi:hypothetical protein
MPEWEGYEIANLAFEYEPGTLVADVGCGGGQMDQMLRLVTDQQAKRFLGLPVFTAQVIQKPDSID